MTNAIRFEAPAWRTLLTSAVASATLAALAVTALPASADARSKNVEKAERALEKDKAEKAVSYAERAVSEAPRQSDLRVLLGEAYLKAGRMVSARDSLAAAVELGDSSGRTALMLALAQIGAGEPRMAIGTINMQGGAIPAVDRGLALALAGEAARGVEVLSAEIRAGNNTPKSRQNLAYAFALDGRWREARLMAMQDVPANKIGERITEWATTARPDQGPARIAAMMNAELASDRGMPQQLALSNSAPPLPIYEESVAAPQMARAELPATTAPVVAKPVAESPVAEPVSEKLLAVAEPGTGATKKPAWSVEPQPAAKPALVSLAVVQPVASNAIQTPVVVARAGPAAVEKPAAKPAVKVAARSAAPKPAPKPAAKPAPLPVPTANGSHVAQLGSYASQEQAVSGWKVFQARYSNLRQSKPVITRASVNGQEYWRVSAGGFDSDGAYAMCKAVKASGHGCLPITMPETGAPARAPRLAKAN